MKRVCHLTKLFSVLLKIATLLLKNFNFYKTCLDMFKDGLTVPGLTLKYLFSTVDKNVTFNLFDKKNQDLFRLIKENIVGGPSIIFHRCHAKTQNNNQTRKIRKHCKSVSVDPGVRCKRFVFELYYGIHADWLFYTLS